MVLFEADEEAGGSTARLNSQNKNNAVQEGGRWYLCFIYGGEQQHFWEGEKAQTKNAKRAAAVS